MITTSRVTAIVRRCACSSSLHHQTGSTVAGRVALPRPIPLRLPYIGGASNTASAWADPNRCQFLNAAARMIYSAERTRVSVASRSLSTASFAADQVSSCLPCLPLPVWHSASTPCLHVFYNVSPILVLAVGCDLQPSIRSLSSLLLFRRALKTELFKHSFCKQYYI